MIRQHFIDNELAKLYPMDIDFELIKSQLRDDYINESNQNVKLHGVVPEQKVNDSLISPKYVPGEVRYDYYSTNDRNDAAWSAKQ